MAFDKLWKRDIGRQVSTIISMYRWVDDIHEESYKTVLTLTRIRKLFRNYREKPCFRSFEFRDAHGYDSTRLDSRVHQRCPEMSKVSR